MRGLSRESTGYQSVLHGDVLCGKRKPLTVQTAATPRDLPHSEHCFRLAVNHEHVFGADFVGMFRVRQEVGVNRASDGQTEAFFRSGRFAAFLGRVGFDGRRQLQVERERNRIRILCRRKASR